MQQPGVAPTVTCALTPRAAESSAALRLLWRDEPVHPGDSGWRIGVPGEDQVEPPSGTAWVPWDEACAREPALRQLGDAKAGTRVTVLHERGGEVQIRDASTGARLVLNDDSPAAGPRRTSVPVDVRSAAEQELLQRYVRPAMAAAGAGSLDRLEDALYGAVLLTPTGKATGAPSLLGDTLHLFTDQTLAALWAEVHSASIEPGPWESRLVGDVLKEAAAHGAAWLEIDERPGAAGVRMPITPALLHSMGQCDHHAMLALRSGDASILETLAADPTHRWLGISDAADASGALLTLRDHESGASALLVFARHDHAAAYDDLADPAWADLDALRRDWEPESGLLLGLGSELRPLELSWGRLRKLGFAAGPGAVPYAAPSPRAHTEDNRAGEPEPFARPAPVPVMHGSWELTLGTTEREIVEAVLEFARGDVEAASVLIVPTADHVDVSLAYVSGGVAHAASHLPGADSGSARLALLRFRIVSAVGALVRSLRERGAEVPAAWRLQVLPGASGGAVHFGPLATAGGPDAMREWMQGQGIAADACLASGALLTADQGTQPMPLAKAVRHGDAAAAAVALGKGAPAWTVLDAAGSPLRLHRPSDGAAVLAVFTSEEAARSFAPAGEPVRNGLFALCSWLETLPEPRALGLDPSARAAPLVVDSAAALAAARAHAAMSAEREQAASAS